MSIHCQKGGEGEKKGIGPKLNGIHREGKKKVWERRKE